MDPEGSVKRWIPLLKDGNCAAASPLWEAYFHRLAAFESADRRRTRPVPRGQAPQRARAPPVRPHHEQVHLRRVDCRVQAQVDP